MFAVVNAALIVLKLRPGEPRGRFEVPLIVPAVGIVINLALIIARLTDPDPRTSRTAPLIALGLGVLIVILYLVMRPKEIPESETEVA
jgi:APA family basic amino acid/polyamine antiporter